MDNLCSKCGHYAGNHAVGTGMCLQSNCLCDQFVIRDLTNLTKPNKRAEILQTAENLVNGDRAQTYGPPEISFGRIADLWNAMGMHVYVADYGTGESRPLTAVDVALALTQLKISRIIGSPSHEDSWIDGAGYLALGGEMATREGEN